MYNVQNAERLLTAMTNLAVLASKLQAGTHPGAPIGSGTPPIIPAANRPFTLYEGGLPPHVAPHVSIR